MDKDIYIKQLEEQNEKLKSMLAATEAQRDSLIIVRDDLAEKLNDAMTEAAQQRRKVRSLLENNEYRFSNDRFSTWDEQ